MKKILCQNRSVKKDLKCKITHQKGKNRKFISEKVRVKGNVGRRIESEE